MVAEHNLDDLGADGGSEAAAAECGGVASVGEALGDLVGGEDAAHGEAVGKGLGHGDDVRLHVVVLEGPELAGAPHAGLYLVAHEERSVLPAEPLNALDVALPQRKDAAFALDALDEDGCGVLVHGLGKGIEVAGRHLLEALGDRLEAVHEIFPAGSCEGGERAAVEAAGQGDDVDGIPALHLGLVAAGQLDGRLVGFGAGVAEEGLAEVGRGKEQASQLKLRLLVEEVAHVPEGVGLLHEGFVDLVVAVANGRDGDAGEQVDVFLAVDVPEAGSLAEVDGNGVASVGF